MVLTDKQYMKVEVVKMEYAKYSSDIREILEKVNKDQLENLLRNVVKYAHEINNSKCNWTAHELFIDVLEENDIIEIFDED